MLMGSVVIVEFSSSAFEEEEDSLASFISFLLIFLLSLRMGEKHLSLFFFFLPSSEGLDLVFFVTPSQAQYYA